MEKLNSMTFCQNQIWNYFYMLNTSSYIKKVTFLTVLKSTWLNLEILYLIPIICYVFFEFSESLEHKNNVANFSSIDLVCFNIWFCEANNFTMVSPFFYSQNFTKHGSDADLLPVTLSDSICNKFEFALNSTSLLSFFGWARKNKLVRIQMHWSVLLLFLFLMACQWFTFFSAH